MVIYEESINPRRIRYEKTTPKNIVGLSSSKKKINDVAFSLELSEPMKQKGIHDTFHVSLLKPYVDDKFDRDPAPEPAMIFADGHQEFEVEQVLSHRKRRGKTEFW